jgi:hypothetical protein
VALYRDQCRALVKAVTKLLVPLNMDFFFHWAETHLFLKQDTAPRIYSEIDGNYAVLTAYKY